jgi:hypothetical protein
MKKEIIEIDKSSEDRILQNDAQVVPQAHPVVFLVSKGVDNSNG